MGESRETPEGLVNSEDTTGLKELAGALIYGGSMQLSAESLKILFVGASDKFPQGWESLNVLEEVLEGAIPTVVGALAGKAIYRLGIDMLDADYDKFAEQKMMVVLGY